MHTTVNEIDHFCNKFLLFQVLGLFGFDSSIDGTKVVLEAADNSAEQMWYRGTKSPDGYFTLQNPVSRKFLTAPSPKITTITGN